MLFPLLLSRIDGKQIFHSFHRKLTRRSIEKIEDVPLELNSEYSKDLRKECVELLLNICLQSEVLQKIFIETIKYAIGKHFSIEDYTLPLLIDC